MKGQEALFSKVSDEWETPLWLFNQLNQEFHFDCDAAATDENSLCGDGWLQNALEDPWLKWKYRTFFLNPPYSKIAAFMQKAYEEALKGATVVCLIPSRTDTVYWHNYCMKASEIRFIKGRLKFLLGGNVQPHGATFPSCIIIFDERMLRDNWNNPLICSMSKA